MRVERVDRITNNFQVLLDLAEPNIFMTLLPDVLYCAFDDDNRECGCLAAAVTDDRLIIRKLYVYPDKKNSDAALMLLDAAWQYATSIGFDTISFMYCTVPGVPSSFSNSLDIAGFSAPVEISNVWVNTGEAAMESPVYKKRKGVLPKGDKIVKLSEVYKFVSEKDVPAQVRSMIKDDYNFSSYPSDKGSRSVAYISEKLGVVASILTANRGHYIHVYDVFLKSAKCVNMLVELFATLTDISIRGYGSKDVRFINYLNGEDKVRTFEKLMGNAHFRKCVIMSTSKFNNASTGFAVSGEQDHRLKIEMLSELLLEKAIEHDVVFPNNDFAYIKIKKYDTNFKISYICDEDGKIFTCEMITDRILKDIPENAVCRKITQTYTKKKLMYAGFPEERMEDAQKTITEMIIPFIELYK